MSGRECGNALMVSPRNVVLMRRSDALEFVKGKRTKGKKEKTGQSDKEKDSTSASL